MKMLEIKITITANDRNLDEDGLQELANDLDNLDLRDKLTEAMQNVLIDADLDTKVTVVVSE
jgi:hypothetical protein